MWKKWHEHFELGILKIKGVCFYFYFEEKQAFRKHNYSIYNSSILINILNVNNRSWKCVIVLFKCSNISQILRYNGIFSPQRNCDVSKLHKPMYRSIQSILWQKYSYCLNLNMKIYRKNMQNHFFFKYFFVYELAQHLYFRQRVG